MGKKNSAPESAINQKLHANYINLLTIAASFPEAVLLLVLIVAEVLP